MFKDQRCDRFQVHIDYRAISSEMKCNNCAQHDYFDWINVDPSLSVQSSLRFISNPDFIRYIPRPRY